MQMESQTKINVQRKRKVLQKKRRIKWFRIFVALLLLGALLTVAGWLTVNIYNWTAAKYAVYAEMYNDYKARRELRAANFDARFDGYTNILFMGFDPGLEDTGKQADNLFLLSFRHEDGAVRIMQIPRYTLVDIPGISQPTRINNAFYYGGINLVEQSASKLLNVTIHHYVAIDTEALVELVDIMGGIDVYVETDMDYEDPVGNLYIHIPKGYQHMDGETAQQYLRFAADELGTYGRAKRQQAFMKAVYNRILQPDMMMKLSQLSDVWNRRVDSTIEGFDSVHFANLVRKLSNQQPELMILPGGWDQYGSWVCDKQALDEKIQELFPVEADNTEESNGFFGFFKEE